MRAEYIRFKVMPSGNIRAFQSDTNDKRGVTEWMLTNPKNPADTVTTSAAQKIIIKYE